MLQGYYCERVCLWNVCFPCILTCPRPEDVTVHCQCLLKSGRFRCSYTSSATQGNEGRKLERKEGRKVGGREGRKKAGKELQTQKKCFSHFTVSMNHPGIFFQGRFWFRDQDSAFLASLPGAIKAHGPLSYPLRNTILENSLNFRTSPPHHLYLLISCLLRSTSITSFFLACVLTWFSAMYWFHI